MNKTALFLPAIITSLTACGTSSDEPYHYQHAKSLSPYQQSSFEQYVLETQNWLKLERNFITEDIDREIELNSPTEYQPKVPNGEAILLVHGLGDSPYSFSDIAKRLSDKGYLVRTILLPGHGSKVGDLKLVSADMWQESVEHQIKLLQSEYSNVWLGGYSTGANLVTSYALTDDSIKGLILYSPAFNGSSDLLPMAKYAQYVIEWADQDPETNYLRYDSLPMAAAASYYETTQRVQKALKTTPKYSKPVFMLISEGDTVVDKYYAVDQFATHFNNPNSRLVWLGSNPPIRERTTAYNMQLPELRISEGSHMGGLFSPDNPEYGIHGKNRLCNNGQDPELEARCLAGDEVWYSSYGYVQEGKIHARLTYNPYFDESLDRMEQVLKSK
ncbi:lysophospholipase [Vibrio ishigakensis]|uniref:Lysophospholipase n=1 Tax=Vibrio ishigakensis TaxID=1481914 RepID=A0A0B8NYX4_9VIBR|nr:alpha/beta fold hydrolase [Vibrio ishigakensis]GAM57512.1 lysophospholipase [Vibrio ishigakensis]